MRKRKKSAENAAKPHKQQTITFVCDINLDIDKTKITREDIANEAVKKLSLLLMPQ